MSRHRSTSPPWATRRRSCSISHEASLTGAPRIAAHAAHAFVEHGDECVTVLRWNGPLRDELARSSSRLVLEPFRHVRAMVRRLAGESTIANMIDEAVATLTLRRLRPDLVYANTVKSAAYVRPARRLGISVVLHVHELEPLASATLARYRLDAEYDDVQLVACSTAVAENLAVVTGQPRHEITVVPSVVDSVAIRELADTPATIARSNASVEVPFRVGACGTADERKGFDLFLDAASKLTAGRDEPLEFVWIGRHNADAVTAVAALPDDVNVVLTGELDNPLPTLRSLDVFTLPSRSDPFPLVVLEAMALERPVVAFDVGGLREQLATTGVLVAPGNTDALADEINELLDDPERRAQLGADARARVEAEFGLATFGREVLAAAAQARWS